MKVVIFGANGGIGKRVVSQLKNHSVTAVVRTSEQQGNFPQPNVSSVVVSLDETSPAMLAKVIVLHDAVVFTAGSGGKNLLQIDLDAAVKVFEAAEAAKVRRLILVSAIFTDNREWIDASPIRNYYIAKAYADRILVNEFATSLDFTIVKPTRLTNEPGTGTIEKVILGQDRGEITRDDVALVIADILDKRDTFGKSYDIKNGTVPIGEYFS